MAGRPRDAGLELRLLAAAWALLTQEGYEPLTLSRVAADARAQRTDLRRRWPSKAQLVTAALAEHLPPVPQIDTGTLYGDLRAGLDALATAWSAPWMDGLTGLLADLHRDPAAETAFRAMAERRGEPVRAAIGRAVERGEVATGANRVLAGDLLEGPLMHRRLIARQPITPDELDAIASWTHRFLTEKAAADA
ncbi:TetR/AcrR family transcriptional regulator C-terminal ligand-binding domain-containing protein [Kribbella sp. NBC_01505]|uniref:TetR-like C-terminal domain-containing protein n=1 Tax=Kribbella sp. NBC_01505 TaxID=2903580 RepID=UPI003866A9A6